MRKIRKLLIIIAILLVLFPTAISKLSDKLKDMGENTEAISQVEEISEKISEITDKFTTTETTIEETKTKETITSSVDEFTIPEYDGENAYTVINNNIPYFEASEITTSVFETYSELDSLGRCGVAYANVCREIMPTEDREEIGSVKPSGWTYNGKSNNHKYDFVDGKYIYNRCHLIGFQLAGENANEKNLVTGTRYFNVTGMLPFENMVADFVDETNYHILYRVTPYYDGDDLVCKGVLMEAYSVEDNGDGIEFCVFVHNVQPGVTINYATGENY